MKRPVFWLSLLAACNTSTPPEPAPTASASSVAPPVDAAPPVFAKVEVDAGPDPAMVMMKGKFLYGRYCAFCHGESGEGYKADQAPALANPEFLSIATDSYIERTITKGRPGTTMSPWSQKSGGPLGPSDVTALTTYVRAWQKNGTAPEERPDAGAPSGDIESGAKLYAANCEKCHGKEGKNGKHNALANPEFEAAADDFFLRASISKGRPGTPMVAFEKPLGAAKIDDLVAVLRSWNKPPELLGDLPPLPGKLQSAVFHAGGPPAALDANAEFIPVDTIKKAYDAGQAMIIIDARPPADYARMHIAGAISVPFYGVDKYAPEIPKNAFILTYCGCPHAESGQVRAALKKLDYPKVAVMDEGLFAWRDRGYPVRGGAKP